MTLYLTNHKETLITVINDVLGMESQKFCNAITQSFLALVLTVESSIETWCEYIPYRTNIFPRAC